MVAQKAYWRAELLVVHLVADSEALSAVQKAVRLVVPMVAMLVDKWAECWVQ